MDDQLKMLCTYAATAIENLITNQQVTRKSLKYTIMRIFSHPMERLAAYESWKRKIEDSGDNDGWAAAYTYWRECVSLSELRAKAVEHLIEATKHITELQDQLEAATHRRKMTEFENENLKIALSSGFRNDVQVGNKLKTLGETLEAVQNERDSLKNSIEKAKEHWSNQFSHLLWNGDLEATMKFTCEKIAGLQHRINVLESREPLLWDDFT